MCNFEKCQNDQESWTVLQQNKSVCMLSAIEIKASSTISNLFFVYIFTTKTSYFVLQNLLSSSIHILFHVEDGFINSMKCFVVHKYC